MDQDSVADIFVSELLSAMVGRRAGAFVEGFLDNAYDVVWRFAAVRFEFQRSPFRYVFL